VSIEDQAELEALRAAGRVVAETLRELRGRVRPGVTTAELDAAAARVFARHGARSGPQLDYRFPGTVCLSVDDECVHGIPGPRRLRAGQLVKLDVTAELGGFYADACVTVPVARAKPRAQRLAAAAASALRRGLAPESRWARSAPRWSVRCAGAASRSATSSRATASAGAPPHAEHTIVITAGAPLVLTA
jgi:methionyl aminopeptidase